MGHGGELIGRKLGGGLSVGERLERPDPEVGERDDGERTGLRPVERAAVAPQRTVGAMNVTEPIGRWCGSSSDRKIDRMDTRRSRVASIDAVGQHQVPNDLARKVGIRGQLPIRKVEHRVRRRERVAELDHHSLPGGSMGSELGHCGWVVACEGDSDCVGPGGGHLGACVDHHIAAECIGPGEMIPHWFESDARRCGRLGSTPT